MRFILVMMTAALALLPGELPAQVVPRNILLVVGDDIGTDSLSMFNTNTVDTSFAPTPNLDALAAQGVKFRNCYGYPSCSPTRSCLLTGRYGFRTGIGAAIDDVYDPYLSPRDFTIPKALDANPQLGFQHAQIGKWHLSENAIDPNLIGGWSHYSGFLAGERSSYYEWEKTVNGVNAPTTTYTTSDNATDAINWITAQGTNRWFLWFAPKAAHSPLHKPPNELHSYDFLPAEPPANGAFSKLYYQAMIEAMDTEMGRLMTNINLAETMVVFIGDNGTPIETVQSPYTTNQCKGTLTEGGIRLPMFIVGAGVVDSNRWTDAVVHAVDVTTTMLDMAGVSPATLPTNMVFDGRSFAPVIRNEPWNPTEQIILTENFGSIIPPPLRGVAARGPRYKLIKLDAGLQLFYDLQTDPYEHTNLFGNLTPQQLLAYASLTNRLTEWHNTPVAPAAAGFHVESGAFTMSVSEQLGIAYSLVRATNLTAPQWLPMTNFVREIHPTEPIVLLSDPSPPAAAFYRVSANGR
jgi:arylsulfatase B